MKFYVLKTDLGQSMAKRYFKDLGVMMVEYDKNLFLYFPLEWISNYPKKTQANILSQYKGFVKSTLTEDGKLHSKKMDDWQIEPFISPISEKLKLLVKY